MYACMCMEQQLVKKEATDLKHSKEEEAKRENCVIIISKNKTF